MKILKCTDIGMKCGFAAIGMSADDVKRKMFDHAAKVHTGMIENMSPQQKKDMERKMDELLN